MSKQQTAHERKLWGRVHALAIQYEKRRLTRLLRESTLTRIAPRMATEYASTPEYARPSFQCVAESVVHAITMTVREHAKGRQSVRHLRTTGGGRAGSTRQTRTLDGPVDAADERRLEGREAEPGDDDLALVAQLQTRGGGSGGGGSGSQLRAPTARARRAGGRRLTEFVTFLDTATAAGSASAAVNTRMHRDETRRTRWRRRRRRATSSGPGDTR